MPRILRTMSLRPRYLTRISRGVLTLMISSAIIILGGESGYPTAVKNTELRHLFLNLDAEKVSTALHTLGNQLYFYSGEFFIQFSVTMICLIALAHYNRSYLISWLKRIFEFITRCIHLCNGYLYSKLHRWARSSLEPYVIEDPDRPILSSELTTANRILRDVESSPLLDPFERTSQFILRTRDRPIPDPTTVVLSRMANALFDRMCYESHLRHSISPAQDRVKQAVRQRNKEDLRLYTYILNTKIRSLMDAQLSTHRFFYSTFARTSARHLGLIETSMDRSLRSENALDYLNFVSLQAQVKALCARPRISTYYFSLDYFLKSNAELTEKDLDMLRIGPYIASQDLKVRQDHATRMHFIRYKVKSTLKNWLYYGIRNLHYLNRLDKLLCTYSAVSKVYLRIFHKVPTYRGLEAQPLARSFKEALYQPTINEQALRCIAANQYNDNISAIIGQDIYKFLQLYNKESRSFKALYENTRFLLHALLDPIQTHQLRRIYPNIALSENVLSPLQKLVNTIFYQSFPFIPELIDDLLIIDANIPAIFQQMNLLTQRVLEVKNAGNSEQQLLRSKDIWALRTVSKTIYSQMQRLYVMPGNRGFWLEPTQPKVDHIRELPALTALKEFMQT